MIGKAEEQVKMRLINDELEIIDGTKVVATFGQNQTEITNLKVNGVFEFGYHVVMKIEQDRKRFTIIRPV